MFSWFWKILGYKSENELKRQIVLNHQFNEIGRINDAKTKKKEVKEVIEVKEEKEKSPPDIPARRAKKEKRSQSVAARRVSGRIKSIK